MRKIPRRAFILGLAGTAAGCAAASRAPDLAAIYAPAASVQGPERLPLIGIPGTLGSRLIDLATGTAIWGGEDDLSVDPATPDGMRALALPIGDGRQPSRVLEDGVATDGPVLRARARVLGVPVEVDVYDGLREFIVLAGWVPWVQPLPRPGENQSPALGVPPPEANFFPYPYDWRRDLAFLAAGLGRHVGTKAEQLALRGALLPGADPTVRFNIVAHSMGCLIARYFLMYGTADLPADGSLPELTWAGARNVNKVVLIAPPNAGSITALENLVNGKTLGPLLPFFPPALVGSHFSTYALMPRSRHKRLRWRDSGEPIEDIYDPALWERLGWGMASPGEEANLAVLMPDVADAGERRRRALGFQAEALGRARQFQAALDRETGPLPEGLEVYLVVGGSYRTPAGAVVDRATGAVEIDQWEEGDGVVLRASSLLDERQGSDYSLGLKTPLAYTSTLFLPEEHVALTQSAVFGDNLLFWLTEGRRRLETLQTASPQPMMLFGATRPGPAEPRAGKADR